MLCWWTTPRASSASASDRPDSAVQRDLAVLPGETLLPILGTSGGCCVAETGVNIDEHSSLAALAVATPFLRRMLRARPAQKATAKWLGRILTTTIVFPGVAPDSDSGFDPEPSGCVRESIRE